MGVGNPRHLGGVCLGETLATSPRGSQWSLKKILKFRLFNWRQKNLKSWTGTTLVGGKCSHHCATFTLHAVADTGEGSGPPLIFRPNWGLKGLKTFFWRPPPSPPPLISRSGSGTAEGEFRLAFSTWWSKLTHSGAHMAPIYILLLLLYIQFLYHL